MERPEEVVVADASVITKWFVEEEHSDKALRLRRDYTERLVEIASPELLIFEVLNALRYNPEFGERDLKQSIVALEGYRLWLFPLTGGLAQRTIENALRYGITIYDASYISLGELKGARVYTADETLLEKLRGVKRVCHISRYGRKRGK
jgi:predicted nucleic acid-binding protein